MDFAGKVDHREKVKVIEKIDKYLDFVWEQKNMRNVRVMVMLIVISVLGTAPKGLDEKLG